MLCRPRRGQMADINLNRARRLGAIRRALGFTRTALCRELKIRPSAWTNYEKSGTRPELDTALRLIELNDGLTLDFIYLGRWGGMPPDLAQRIRREMQAEVGR